MCNTIYTYIAFIDQQMFIAMTAMCQALSRCSEQKKPIPVIIELMF